MDIKETNPALKNADHLEKLPHERTWSEFASQTVENPYVAFGVGAAAAALVICGSRGKLAAEGLNWLRGSKIAGAAEEAFPSAASLLGEGGGKVALKSELARHLAPSNVGELLPAATDANPELFESLGKLPNSPLGKNAARLHEIGGENEIIPKSATLAMAKKLVGFEENTAETLRAIVQSDSARKLAKLNQLSNPILEEVALHKNTPPDVLTELATSKVYFVRKFVAMNPNTPAATLDLMAEENSPGIRTMIARNPNTWLGTVEKLFGMRTGD